MKILSISPYFPSEKTGHAGSQYIYRNLTMLSRSHSVKSIFFIDDNELALLNDLTENDIEFEYIIMNRNRFTFQKTIKNLYTLLRAKNNDTPFIAEKYHQSAMHLLTKKTIENFKPDIVHIEYNLMHHYAANSLQVPNILTEHDITTKVKERLFNEIKSNSCKKEYHTWQNYEPNILNKFDAFVTLTNEDKDYTSNWNVPPSYVIPPQFIIPNINGLKKNNLSICFMGSFNRKPNVMALEKLLVMFPEIKHAHPHVKLQIVGKYLPNYIKNRIDQLANVEYMGFILNINEFLFRNVLFVAPIDIGAGLKMKIPHSLSVGTPVLTTSVGAEGILISEKNGLWVAKNDKLFIKQCIDLLKNPDHLIDIKEKCIDAVREIFSPENVLKKLEKMYLEVIQNYAGA